MNYESTNERINAKTAFRNNSGLHYNIGDSSFTNRNSNVMN